MSYSMSPPQKAAPQPAQRPYSPYQNAGSPAGQFGPPPAKRQRMSPDPRSPPNGLANANPYPPQQHSAPQQHMGQHGNPYTQSPVQSPYSPQYGASPQSSFNTPQPYPYPTLPWQQSQPPTPVQAPQQPPQMRQASPPSQQSREMMPPPPRPVKEEKEDKLDLSDSLYGSGINLKDEENYHYAVYSNRHNQSDSFSTVPDSFGSNTMTPNNSFNMLTQGTSFGSQDANGPMAGTLGQTQSQEDIELEVRRKRERAAIAQAEKRQHHLNNQFLLCNNVRKRMDVLARDQGVRLSVQGLLIRQEETAVMTNAAGSQGIAAAGINGQAKQEERPESMVNAGAPYEQIVSLISLATGERLRGLLDESFDLARARRYGDHARVPPDFAEIAEGQGPAQTEQVVPQSITGTQWDKAPESATPQPTVSFPENNIASALRTIAARDKAAEEARIKKREARRRAAANSANADTPVEEAAGASDVAPEGPKMTKKEQLKQAKESKSTEAALHQTTNQTAAMMTMGKKKPRYSWMTGGSAQMPTNRFAKPAGGASASGSGTTTPSAAVKKEEGTEAEGGESAGAKKTLEARAPRWGDWREDGQEGKGIQVRDWVLVLERDGKEKRALQRCYTRMGTPTPATAGETGARQA